MPLAKFLARALFGFSQLIQPIVAMKEMLNHAYRHGYAVGSFDAVSLD